MSLTNAAKEAHSTKKSSSKENGEQYLNIKGAYYNYRQMKGNKKKKFSVK